MYTTKNQLGDSSQCCWDGCSDDGKFPAPKPSMSPKERYYFCLEHIREYNKSWDFFQKMDAAQIDSFQKDTIVGHRPTWKFGVNAFQNNMEEIRKQVFGQFRGSYKNIEEREAALRLPKNIRDALKILGLKYPVTLKEIKQKYKELAKAHHPDLNNHGGDEKIKRINEAYSHLKNSDSFKV